MNETNREFLKTLGLKIKTLRLKKQWSQEELANQCGYTSINSRSTISKIENGTNDIPSSQLKIIANVLGTTPCNLLSDTENDKIIPCDFFHQCQEKDAFGTIQCFLKLDEEICRILTARRLMSCQGNISEG